MVPADAMSDTLDALDRAVIENPPDRTVRLVYADALEETSDPVLAARAEFIRAQLELETLEPDSDRRGALTARASELFDAHWLAWWRPIAAAARLPDPHVPGQRRRDRAPPGVRRPRRKAGWPYTHSAAETAVELDDYGLSFRFVGGFPEEVRFRSLDDPEGGPILRHQWGEAMPLARLAFTFYISAAQWERLDGPHLSRLAALSLGALQPDAAQVIAASPHLAALTELAATVHGSDPDTIRALVALPTWSGLRRLDILDRVSVSGVHALAHGCTLKHLEELHLSLGNPGMFVGAVGEIISGVYQAVLRMVAPGAQGPPWEEYGPALEALARAPWIRRLRVLRIASAHHTGLFGLINRGLADGLEAPQLFPDAAVLALASAAATDKLERLVLPAALVGPSVREELTTRLGARVEFA